MVTHSLPHTEQLASPIFLMYERKERKPGIQNHVHEAWRIVKTALGRGRRKATLNVSEGRTTLMILGEPHFIVK